MSSIIRSYVPYGTVVPGPRACTGVLEYCIRANTTRNTWYLVQVQEYLYKLYLVLVLRYSGTSWYWCTSTWDLGPWTVQVAGGSY